MITPMLVQAYGAAFAIIVGSVVLGKAICGLCGGSQRWWAAPVVGLAALIVIATAAVKLPGQGVTAALVSAAIVLAAGVYLLARSRPRRLPLGDLVVGLASLLGASIPFLANGRVGLLGPPWDNDTAVHLLIAETLHSPKMAKIWPVPGGYPLGPHSLVATLGTAFALPLDTVFTGLLLATISVTAITAADVLAREALGRRVVVGVLCSLTYLVAAYYGEGSFKEPIMAGFVLGFVLQLEQVQARWREARQLARFGLLIPAGVLVAGAINTYSYFGVAWFAATPAVWAVFEVARRPALARDWLSWRRIAAAAPWVAAMALLGVIVLLPIAGQLQTVAHVVGASPTSTISFAANDLGNLPGPLSPYQALGVWTSQDFRYVTNNFHQGELSAFGLGVLAFGVLWSVRQRRLVLPAAAGAAGVIILYTGRTQSPYVAAKALVIGAPLFMALALRALLTSSKRERPANALVLVVAAAFCAFAAYSSYLALQTEPVQAPEPGLELAAFHHEIGDAPVLFLGIDDFASWQLRDSPVDSPASAISVSVGGVIPRSGHYDGGSLDFNSISPTDLDRFRYVITTNTPYASQAPANFRLLARKRLYQLWERTGPTAPFQALNPPGHPGAILDCGSSLGRRLHASRGEASVMTPPVLAPGASLSAGQSGSMSIALPTGRWEISAQYLSYFDLDFSAQRGRWTLPAYLGRNGPWFAVGEVTGHGARAPVTVVARADRPSPLTGGRVTAVSIYQIAATRVPDTRKVIPLRDACGKYVDWYRRS